MSDPGAPIRNWLGIGWKWRKRSLKALNVLDQSHFADATSRAYYALLHGARALLATKGLDSKKHSGVISLFNQHFVKTGIAPKELGRLLLNAKDIREESDYNEFYLVNKSEAAEMVKQAEVFLQLIRNLVEGASLQ